MSDGFQKLSDVADRVVDKLRPIPTRHRGVLYRSRLEARWAVFFDLAGIAAEYEAEGYDLDGTWYLPDWWLPDLGIFVEVKPTDPSEAEAHKAELLAAASGKTVLVAIGIPGSHKGWLFGPAGRMFEGLPVTQAVLSRCRRCNIPIISYGGADCWGEHKLAPCAAAAVGAAFCTDKLTPLGNGFETAATKARDARFEREKAAAE